MAIPCICDVHRLIFPFPFSRPPARGPPSSPAVTRMLCWRRSSSTVHPRDGAPLSRAAGSIRPATCPSWPPSIPAFPSTCNCPTLSPSPHSLLPSETAKCEALASPVLNRPMVPVHTQGAPLYPASGLDLLPVDPLKLAVCSSFLLFFPTFPERLYPSSDTSPGGLFCPRRDDLHTHFAPSCCTSARIFIQGLFVAAADV